MRFLTALLFTTALFAVDAPKPSPLKPAKTKKVPDIVASITQPEDTVRTIHYNDRIIETIHAKLNYTTLVVLPANEKVVEVACGNTDEWTANPSAGGNVAYVRPDKAKSKTNLNVVAASGNVYSFLIAEGDAPPDLKVFVKIEQPEMLATLAGRPKWVLGSELEDMRMVAESATKEATSARDDFNKKSQEMREQADRELATFRNGFPSSLKHDYAWKDKQREFNIHAIAHSKDFTYIWCDPQEVPALYELKDGKPSLVAFEYSNGVYVVNKVMQSGYLQVGKHKLEFRKEGY